MNIMFAVLIKVNYLVHLSLPMFAKLAFATRIEPDQTDQIPVLLFDIPKKIMDSSKNVRWIIPFKKFGIVRVNIHKVYQYGKIKYM